MLNKLISAFTSFFTHGRKNGKDNRANGEETIAHKLFMSSKNIGADFKDLDKTEKVYLCQNICYYMGIDFRDLSSPTY